MPLKSKHFFAEAILVFSMKQFSLFMIFIFFILMITVFSIGKPYSLSNQEKFGCTLDFRPRTIIFLTIIHS